MIHILEDSRAQAQRMHFIRTALSDHLLTVTLNRPLRSNSFTLGMYVLLTQILLKAENDDQVTSILLVGEGKNFCSGNDLSNFLILKDTSQLGNFAEFTKNLLERFIQAFLAITKPLLAVCQGRTIGFAFSMLPLFDKVWAAKDSTFRAPFVQIMQSPQFGSSITFVSSFGMKLAKEIILEGKQVGALELQKREFLQSVDSVQQGVKMAMEFNSRVGGMDLASFRGSKRLMSQKVRGQVRRQNQELKARWQAPNLIKRFSLTKL